MDLTIHILGFALLYIGFRMEEHAVRLLMSEAMMPLSEVREVVP